MTTAHALALPVTAPLAWPAPSSSADTGAESSDETLLHRIRDRDLDALGALYDRYSGQAFALARRMLRDRESAEEVVQDAFMSVWRQAQTYNPGLGRVKPWLLSIVHHRAIDRLRRTQGKPVPAYLDDAWMTAAPSDTAAEAIQNVDRGEIRAYVRALPHDQRKAIELSYFAGHTFVEIARMTGVPVGTVKSRVRLGLGKLRERMSGDRGLIAEPA